MKFAWILALIVGLGVLFAGISMEGTGGAVLMMLGMLVTFASIPLFILGEYEPQETQIES